MNTAKLHIIARDLLTELGRVDVVSLLEKVIQALQQQINQPQQPNHQQQLSLHLTSLYDKLGSSPVEDYSPAWRDAMDELGVREEFGSKLEEKIKCIFESNKVTLQSALEELTEVHKEISNTETYLTGLIDGLEFFSVGEDALNDDECEVGIIVPRSYVDDNMKSFGSELIKLEKILIVFSELATGKREPLKIRQISSSELSVFLQYLPEIGACLAIAVERIVALYKQLLEIKKLKRQLVAQKVPEERLSGIDSHAASIVSPALDQLSKELMEQYGGHFNQSRKNEISIEIRHSLNKLANRIDRGFNVELRVSPIEDGAENEGDSDGADTSEKARRQIIRSGSQINHLEKTGEPVLFLPEDGGD